MILYALKLKPCIAIEQTNSTQLSFISVRLNGIVTTYLLTYLKVSATCRFIRLDWKVAGASQLVALLQSTAFLYHFQTDCGDNYMTDCQDSSSYMQLRFSVIDRVLADVRFGYAVFRHTVELCDTIW